MSTGPEPPAVDPPDLGPLEPAGLEDVGPEVELVARSLSAVRLSGDLRGMVLEECVLTGVSVAAADLHRLRLRDCGITALDAPSLRASYGDWRAVTLSRSRLGAAELYDSTWRSVRIADSRVGFLNLRGSRIDDLDLAGCRIDELDLNGAVVRRARLTGCRIGILDLSGADLDNVDLRGVELDRLVGLEGLRGCFVAADQLVLLAPLLAQHVGLTVVPG